MAQRQYFYAIALLLAGVMLSGMVRTDPVSLDLSLFRKAAATVFQCPFLMAPACVEPYPGL